LSLKNSATHYSQQRRAERLIAARRVVLAAFGFLSAWLGPSNPAR